MTPSTTSTTVNWLYFNSGPSSADDTFLTAAYKYGVINSPLNPENGDAYYWNSADGKLWLNKSNSSSVQISTDPIKDFAVRGNSSETTEDGYAFFWDTNGSLWYNVPAGNTELDTSIKGFGLRDDGYVYFWDSATSALFLNEPTTDIEITSDALGFGMRNDGYGFYWDATQNDDLFVNAPSGFANISNGPVQSFATDGYCIDVNAVNSTVNGPNYYIGGTGYFVTSGSTNLYKSSSAVGAGLLLSNLKSPTLNPVWRESSGEPTGQPGLGASIYVQTTTGNGSFVFEPLYGSPTVNTGSGPELTSSTAKEYVIYWGTQWPSPSTGPNETTINTGINALFASNYLKSLNQYNSSITGNVTLTSTWTDTTDTLGSTFSTVQIENVVTNAINTNGWPKTTNAANAAIYMVITQPGTSFSGSNEDNGFHGEFTDGSGNKNIFGWAEDSGSTASLLIPFSHETVESITDPIPVFNSNGSVNASLSGITETAAPAITTLLGTLGFIGTTDELADYEPNLLNYSINFVNGSGATVYAAQAYWSKSLQAYILET